MWEFEGGLDMFMFRKGPIGGDAAAAAAAAEAVGSRSGHKLYYILLAFLQLWFGIKKYFLLTHNQGLCQLFFTVF